MSTGPDMASESPDHLDYPEVAIDPVYATVTSNVSGISSDSMDPSWMDDLGFTGGVIQFVYDETSVQKVLTWHVLLYSSIQTGQSLSDYPHSLNCGTS